MENNFGKKCLEYPCIMQISDPRSHLTKNRVRSIDSEIHKFVHNRVWKCLCEHGRQWKGNFESLIYRFVRFLESIHISRFAEILPRKLETRFLFRPSLILKTATGKFLLWNQTGGAI